MRFFRRISILILPLFSIFFIQTVFAAPKPGRCPAVDVIKNAGLSIVEKDDELAVYLVGQINQYNTKHRWAFIIGVPFDQAVSSEDAMNKAVAAVATLRGNPKPEKGENGMWVCFYENDYSYISLAAEPFKMDASMYSKGKKTALLREAN